MNHHIIDITTLTSTFDAANMAILNKKPLSDISDNMKMDTAEKRLAYQESIWAVKEIDLIEDKRKLEMRIAILEQEVEAQIEEVAHITSRTEDKLMENIQSKMRLISEDKERMHRELLSLQKQLDYYKGETESLQNKMKEADNVLSEKMALTRQVIALQLELENEKRATARTTKTAHDNRDSEKSSQKEITELKAQLAKQMQLTEKAKADAAKAKEDWEKQKIVLEAKLEKEKAKNKTLQEKKTGTKRKAPEDDVVPPMLSPMKPSLPPATKAVKVTAPAPAAGGRKPSQKKAQPAVSEFSTTPFLARQGSVIPQPSPSIIANTSIIGRSMPLFGGNKSKRAASVAKQVEEPTESTILEEDTSIADASASTSILTDAGIPKKKKRKLNGGTGNRTLLAVPDESPAHGLNEFGVSALMLDSPATRPKFGGNHLLSTVKKPKGGLLWNLKKTGLKFDKSGEGLGSISPEKGSDKMKDIKKGFTLKL